MTAYIDRIIALQAPNSEPLLERALASATVRKTNVLELGCGCGIVGIGLAQTIPDCDVLLTDLPEAKEVVEYNIEASNLAISSSVRFAALDWERPLPPAVRKRTFNIIIAAECIYNTDSIPPLVKTLSALITKSPKAVVLVATKFRHESERLFFDLACKSGLIESSKMELPLPGQAGYGYGDFSTHVDFHVLHGKDYRASYGSDEFEKDFELGSGSD